MIDLITSFYISKYSDKKDFVRSKELQTTLLNNINCPVIKKIHLFIDDNDSYIKLLEIINKTNTKKIHIIGIKKKPLYSDYFSYSINNLPNRLCMISNSDIFLHKCSIALLNMLNKNKWAYALSRHEYDFSSPQIDKYLGSHDCYIFNSQHINMNIIDKLQFKQNCLAVETQIIKALHDENIKILNPCKQIQIIHLHKSDLRKWDDWVGLHKYGDEEKLKNSCWYIPPTFIKL